MLIRRLMKAALVASAALLNAPLGAQSRVNAASPDTVPTYIEMRNVHFHVGGDVVLRIRSLRGFMRGRDGVVNFDDATSFTTWVDSAEAGLTGEDLSRLFNNHVFAYPGAPLRKIRVELRDGQLHQSGILHKGVDIPFKIKAVVSVTPDGRIRLHPVDTDILGVDGDKLMKALGLTMQKMVDVSKAVGITIEKNDFLIDPIGILPPPKIRGRLLAVRVENGELVQQIGPEPATRSATQLASARRVPPDTSAKNYMYYRGGKLHFGRKLLMEDADMQVIDGDPTTPFDFNLDKYILQLVAGYSRTLPNAALRVMMPDANNLTRLEQSVGGEVTSKHEVPKPAPPRMRDQQ